MMHNTSTRFPVDPPEGGVADQIRSADEICKRCKEWHECKTAFVLKFVFIWILTLIGSFYGVKLMATHSLQRETEVLAQHLEQILMIDQWGELEVKTAAQSDLIRTLLSMHQATHDEGQSLRNPPSDVEEAASYTENVEQNVQPICTDAKTFPFAGENVCALNQFIDATSDEDMRRGNSVNENDSTMNKTSVIDFEDAAKYEYGFDWEGFEVWEEMSPYLPSEYGAVFGMCGDSRGLDYETLSCGIISSTSPFSVVGFKALYILIDSFDESGRLIGSIRWLYPRKGTYVDLRGRGFESLYKLENTATTSDDWVDDWVVMTRVNKTVGIELIVLGSARKSMLLLRSLCCSDC